MIRHVSLPRRVITRWGRVRLGARVAFLVALSAAAGYATGLAAQLEVLAQIPVTAAGVGVAVTLTWHAAGIAQASEDEVYGLRVIARAWFRDTADKAKYPPLDREDGTQ